MFARQVARATARRNFSASAKSAAHFKEGVYENIPFKVHNRRIPFAVLHFSFFGLAFAIPFVACGVQLKRSGAF
ncbi:CYFA0S02e04302g1_1 [Cyberlindnera fabianii]|uniref:Cytochrome c oxidase subunit 8, mitochondrial n=1 Tax=Cyberlindnera fabianii TaxID=36022 RepID=A0A061AV98_CYBFA|nr:Cytochrome c oxidase polypeptide VIII, mitochondrial [Cyberlindnera fabianii]CDR38665.1 CYFA0S02e04302g1_1 [Cyberlindnera fabianii]